MNNLHELMEASHNKHAQDMNAGIYCILIMRKDFQPCSHVMVIKTLNVWNNQSFY